MYAYVHTQDRDSEGGRQLAQVGIPAALACELLRGLGAAEDVVEKAELRGVLWGVSVGLLGYV